MLFAKEGDISADLEKLFNEERKIIQKKGNKKKKEAVYFCQGPLSRLLSAFQQVPPPTPLLLLIYLL